MTFEFAEITINPLILVLWGFLVGLVFSLVGAAGGILASVGLISVIGVTDPNMIKPMAQILTLVSPFIAVPGYIKQGRLVISLAVWLGAGGVIGALIGSTFSTIYLDDLRSFKPVFGAFTLLIAAQLGWSLYRLKQKKSLNRADHAAAAFENHASNGGKLSDVGVRHLSWSPLHVKFEFGGQRFDYHPWKPFLAGLGIAVISSALGVGGGFLLVPFMATLMGLPMFIVAATAASAIVISSIASVSNYLALGIEIDIPMLLFLLLGVIGGSYLGPWLSRYMRDAWLRVVLCVILLLIGLRYLGLFH